MCQEECAKLASRFERPKKLQTEIIYPIGGTGRIGVLELLLIITFGFALWAAALVRKTRAQNQNYDARFQRIFNTQAIGFLISDWNGAIEDANDYFLSLVQHTRDELRTGLNWKQLTPPEHMDQSLKALNDLKTRGFTEPFEKEYVRKDGARVWVLVGATSLGDQVVSYILDITERKRTRQDLEEIRNRLEENVVQRTKELLDANRELYRLVSEAEMVTERLRESQSFLDSVIENIPNMIFVKDATTLRFVRLNRAGEDLLGRTRTELLGKSDYDLFPEEQAEFFTSKDRAVLKEQSVLDISEEPITTPTGERYLHTKKIPICDKHGRPMYLLGISEDITEKKQAEMQKTELLDAKAARMAAERTAEKLKFLAEASAALNASLDVHSLLKAFSESIVRRMADWCIVDFYDEKDGSVERMVATAADGQVPEDARNWWESKKLDLSAPEGLAYVVRTGEPRIYRNLDEEHASQYFSGEILKKLVEWGIHSSMVVPLTYHGKVFGSISFIYTSDRTYDDYDLSLAQDLGRRASLAIENARLYAKAFEASQAKSAFLANISHEIRTPLGAMLGFAELVLEDRQLSPSQQEYISTIARNGRQLLRIVDEVLDLSKVESDKIQIERIQFNLRDLFEDVRQLLLLKSSEKGLKLSFTGVNNLPATVYCDPMRLRQILINVIGNAIKFTERGAIEVHAQFKSSRQNPSQGQLEIEVGDTGVGITEDHTARLFQAFVQADGSTTRKYGGTGLGLFLSRKLARLLGGDVVLRRSVPGRGSEFVITLEMETVNAKPSDKAVSVPHITQMPDVLAPAAAGDFRARILVVDDSADNRMLIGAMLGKLGLHLDMADNGCRAVEMALAGDYDLVFMDIQMPEMDGFQVVKVLTERGYNIPIVALTAHAMKGDRERCLAGGFSDYVCKPVTRKALLNCIERFVTGFSARIEPDRSIQQQLH